MRVGVYVDGYNLYYGGRKACGRSTAGWRWLDVRGLANTLVAEQAEHWPGATVTRLVYCTARVNGRANPSGAADQDVYLKALLATGSVDRIEYGNYISKVIKRPLATEGRRGRPIPVAPAWPIMVQRHGVPLPDATFMASVSTWEEKGSDVNVASHLLLDTLAGALGRASRRRRQPLVAHIGRSGLHRSPASRTGGDVHQAAGLVSRLDAFVG